MTVHSRRQRGSVVGEKPGDVLFLDQAEGGDSSARRGESGRFRLRERRFFCHRIAPPTSFGPGGIGKIVFLSIAFAAEREGVVAVTGREMEGESGKRAFEMRLDHGPARFQVRLVEIGSRDSGNRFGRNNFWRRGIENGQADRERVGADPSATTRFRAGTAHFHLRDPFREDDLRIVNFLRAMDAAAHDVSLVVRALDLAALEEVARFL